MFAWSAAPSVATGVVDRSFRIVREEEAIPGVIWHPEAATRPVPVVLIGHGGSGHKRSERVVVLARWFARHGLAAVAIDGPFHGDRHVDEYQARIVAEGAETVLDRMTADWCHTVEAISRLDYVDVTALAYVGMSMGARYGLSLAASLGAQLRCMVLGKFGMVASSVLPTGMHPEERIERDARRVSSPLLFHIQWDDEIFPRAGQLDLFTKLGSDEKQLIAYRGLHGETRPSAITAWCRFIASRVALTCPSGWGGVSTGPASGSSGTAAALA
jgi:dienelactone hydrolase